LYGFRIRSGLLCRLLEKEFDCCEGEYDLVSVVGSAKDLLGQEAEKDFLLKQIALSKKLHQIKKWLFYTTIIAALMVSPTKSRRTKSKKATYPKSKPSSPSNFPTCNLAPL